MPKDVREFLHTRLNPSLLPEETVDKQIKVATLLVDNNKSNVLSDTDRNTIIMIVAGWLSYRAYTVEVESTKGEVPRTMTTQLLALERLADRVLLIAAQMGSTGAEGIEGLTGDQRSELHDERLAGSLPEGQNI